MSADRFPEVIPVLEPLLEDAHRAALRRELPDRRQVFHFAASLASVPEETLRRAVAGRLGVSSDDGPLAVVGTDVRGHGAPDGFDYPSFRSAGALPVRAGDGAVVYCPDPSLVPRRLVSPVTDAGRPVRRWPRRRPTATDRAASAGSVPGAGPTVSLFRWVLADWSAVEAAYARLSAAARSEGLDPDGLEAYRLVTAQARRFDGATALVAFGEGGVGYRVVLPDGRVASGRVAPGVAGGLRDVLESLRGQEPDEEFGETVRRRGSDVYEIDPWPFGRPGVGPTSAVGDPERGPRAGDDLPGSDLPATTAPRVARDVGAEGPPAGDDWDVLVADDDPAFRAVLGRCLRTLGLVPYFAGDAASAVAALNARPSPPRLVVSDVHMPSGGGAAVVAALRSWPGGTGRGGADVPVVVVTSDETADTEEALVDAGADVVIGKRKEARVLLAHLRRILARGAGPT